MSVYRHTFANSMTLHRLLPLAVLLAIVAVLLGPATPARAEIIDFDPATDEVPDLLEPDDLELLDALTSDGFVYILAEPSPTGRYLYAVLIGAEAFQAGFLDLTTGDMVELAEDEVPGQPATSSSWIDDETLGMINVEYIEPDDENEPPEVHYYQVTMGATTGAIDSTELNLSWLQGGLIGASPDLQTMLVMEITPEAPPPKVIELGPVFRQPRPDQPEGLPGLIGEHPLGTIELQQAEFGLALYDLDGTNRRELMSLPPDSGLASLTWSADGARLAIGTQTMPGWLAARERPAEYPPGATDPHLGSINVREALGLVPPEENPLVTGTRLQAFNVASGNTIKSLENEGFPQGVLAGLGFSPSGEKALLGIATRSELEGRQYPTYANPNGVEIYLLDDSLTPVKQIVVPGGDSPMMGAGFLDEDIVYFAVPDELDTKLLTYDLATDEVTTLWHTSGSMFQALPANGKIVFSYSTVDRPMELWQMDAASGAARQLTSLSTAVAEASGLKAAEVTWTDSDGETLHGIYVHHESMPFPPRAPGPVVVWQQGGPGGQMVNGYGSSVESPYSILPNFGIPVFMANAVGRSVKSPDFFSAMADGRNFGQLDIRQIKEGVEHLVERGIADPERIGITGCSYGGYFTLQSLRTYPDFYAAANPQCSLVDLLDEFMFGYTPFVSYLMGRAATADPVEYLNDSPMYGTRDIKTPTLIFHGTNDKLPVWLINNVHDQIDENGVPVQYFRAEGEGHGFSMPPSQKYGAQLQIQFFREYLDVEKFEPREMFEVFLPTAER